MDVRQELDLRIGEEEGLRVGKTSGARGAHPAVTLPSAVSSFVTSPLWAAFLGLGSGCRKIFPGVLLADSLSFYGSCQFPHPGVEVWRSSKPFRRLCQGSSKIRGWKDLWGSCCWSRVVCALPSLPVMSEVALAPCDGPLPKSLGLPVPRQ